MAAVTAAVIGATAAVAGTTMSFVQAGEQKKAMRNAERDADLAMQEARKKLDTNYYDQLSIQKEPYELEREALLAQGAEAIQAGVESERGAAATAGRVQLAQQQGQAGIRSAMGQELTGLEKLSAQEDSRLRDVGIQLDLGEVSGAQMAAANSQQLAAQAEQQGYQGLVNVGQQVASFVPLYQKTAGVKQSQNIQNIASKDYGLNQSDIQKSIASLGSVGGVDFSKTANMNQMQYKDFMAGVSPKILKQVKSNLPNTLSSFRPQAYEVPQNQIPYMGFDPFFQIVR